MMNTSERNREYLPCRWQWILSVLLPLPLALMSCEGRDAVTFAPLEVSAGIVGAHTRAADEKDDTDYEKKGSFETGDLITIRKEEGGAEASSSSYIKGADGWKPETSEQQIETTGDETFVASYPPEFTCILSDQSTYIRFWRSNRLTSTATATANRVKFEFSPAAAKITIIVMYQVVNTAMGAGVAGADVCTESGKTGQLQLLCTSSAEKRHTYTGIVSTSAVSYTISVTTKVGDSQEPTTLSYQEVGGGGFVLEPGKEYQYIFTATSELILSSVVVKEFALEGEQNAGSAT